MASGPGHLEAEVTVTAWHAATCARPGCAQPIQPGELVGLVGEIGPCCARCCGLDPRQTQRAEASATTGPGT
jgi:hypothetical protein